MNEADDEKKALIPRLRFPEFKDAGKWSGKSLASVLVEHGKKDNGNCQVHSVSVHKGVVNQKEHLGRSFAAADTSNYNLAQPSDVIYTKSPTGEFPYGVVKQNNKPFDVIVSPLYGVFRPINKYIGKLVDCYFESPSRAKQFLEPIVQKGAKNTIQISNDVFLSRRIPLPFEPREQKKIADCLSSLDELITTEIKKLEVLRIHRNGLMQQLFPRDGKAVPHLRLPEFLDAGEWKEEKLEELANRGSGHTPSKSNPEYYNGGIKWISLADSKKLDSGLISETEIEISQKGIDNSSATLHPAGTVILSRDAGVGKSAVMGASMAVSQHFITWTCHSGQLLNWFLYYTLQRSKPLFERVATGSTIKTIGLPFFLEMRIRLPSLPEQQKIADFLSSIDDLIAAQSRRIDCLKTQKRGLVQQLFPMLNEVPV